MTDIETRPAYSPNRRRRNWAILLVLVFWVILIFGITIIKIMGE